MIDWKLAGTVARGVANMQPAGDPAPYEQLAEPAAEAERLVSAYTGLVDVAHRLRAIGTIAAALCQVAAARLDGMLTLKGCRAVDAAAAQLIVREAGGHVAFTRFDDPLAAPLDLLPHSPVVAARSPEALRELAAVPPLGSKPKRAN